MKKKQALFLLIILVITLLAVVGYVMLRVYNTPKAAKPVSAESISVVLDDNYPPYVFRNSEGELQGILVDQWNLWSRTTGVKVKVFVPIVTTIVTALLPVSLVHFKMIGL